MDSFRLPTPPPTPTTPCPSTDSAKHRRMISGGKRLPVHRISNLNLKNIMEEYHEEVLEILHDIETLSRKNFLERLKQV